MRVTQRDIATMAGVSQATVSRVLAGDRRVEETIRHRVSRVMREHNYKPDVRARALRSQRAGLVGLVIKRPQGGLADDPFFAALIGAIVDSLSGTPYHLCVDMASSETSHEALYDEMLRSRRVDGLFLVESEARDERIARLQNDRFPFVVIGNPAPLVGVGGIVDGEVASVDNDNVHAGEMATAHLLANGYRRVGFLGGRKGVTVSDDRIEGFVAAGGDRRLVWRSEFGSEAACEIAMEFLATPDRPDALVVLDDTMAMGVVMASRRLSVRIPRDLGLVGFNDTALCGLLDCGLTSVNLGIDRLVAKSCEKLLAIIEGKGGGSERRTIIPAELTIRGSSRREVSFS